MKIYVKASKAISKSYDKVSEVLQKLFGFDYSKYKRESDWFESDNFGLVKYQLNNAIGDRNSYRIKVYFNDDNDLTNFNNFLRFCNDNDIHVSAKFNETDNPQINIKVEKLFAYTREDVYEVCRFVESYINNITGYDNSKCICKAYEGHWGAAAGAEQVDLRATYFDYSTLAGDPTSKFHKSRIWCDEHADAIAQIDSTICDVILAQFPNIKRCNIRTYGGCGFNLTITFKNT